jgi:osmotically inducible protein OsmC
MKKTATAVWHGSGKEGSGKLGTQSKALDHVPYSWKTRFTEEKGTNPEELIAAAHAGCFSMKLSFVLGEAGHVPEAIHTNCAISLEDGKITESHLNVHAKVPGVSRDQFESYAEKAKSECPVSKALNLKVTLTAVLVDEKQEETTTK